MSGSGASTPKTQKRGKKEISPRKRQKLSLDDLRHSTASPKLRTVGEIHMLATRNETVGSSVARKLQIADPTEADTDSPVQQEITLTRPVKKGSLERIKIPRVVADNRVGRLPAGERGRTGFRFINIADATGTVSIYVHARDSGLQHSTCQGQSVRKTREVSSVQNYQEA